MNNLYKFILVLVLMLSYGFYRLFHDQPESKTRVEAHVDDTAHLKNIEKAFTGTWKTGGPHSQIHTAIANLSDSPGKINVVENKKVAAEKSEKQKKKKKKKTETAKKKTKADRYVSKSRYQDESSNQNLAASGAPPPPPPAAPPKTNIKTIQEWFDFIASPLSRENLETLISSYQSGVVDAATFYGAVDLLLASNVVTVRQLGVIALSATASVQSFDRMVYFISKEPSDAALKSAQSLILNYKKPQNLIILNQVLSASVGSLQIEAAQLIQESANDLLTTHPTTTGTGTGGTGTPPNRVVVAQYQREVQIFTQSLDLIQNIVTQTKSNPNPTLQQAIATLQKLLKA